MLYLLFKTLNNLKQSEIKKFGMCPHKYGWCKDQIKVTCNSL